MIALISHISNIIEQVFISSSPPRADIPADIPTFRGWATLYELSHSVTALAHHLADFKSASQ